MKSVYLLPKELSFAFLAPVALYSRLRGRIGPFSAVLRQLQRAAVGGEDGRVGLIDLICVGGRLARNRLLVELEALALLNRHVLVACYPATLLSTLLTLV